jgi:predicted phosphate transport protein (TIGR00153 family)
MFRLIPKEEKFFEMFKESAQNIHKGAVLLKEMMETWEDPVGMAKRIKDVEHEGDTITHNIARKLNQTFITPIDREDIYSLTSALDDVLDLIEAIADRMLLYRVPGPTPQAKRLAEIIHDSTAEIVKGVSVLGKSNDVLKMCVEINRLENEADRITRDAIADLFQEGKDPIQVIKWKEIYENLEDTTDLCEDVANILESIVLKYT